MSTQHTPGPWVVDVQVSDRNGWASPTQHITITANNERRLIATYSTEYAEYPSDEVNAANARLIAAAPDLLEALQWLTDILPDPELDSDELQRLWTSKARAAIARATQP